MAGRFDGLAERRLSDDQDGALPQPAVSRTTGRGRLPDFIVVGSMK